MLQGECDRAQWGVGTEGGGQAGDEGGDGGGEGGQIGREWEWVSVERRQVSEAESESTQTT